MKFWKWSVVRNLYEQHFLLAAAAVSAAPRCLPGSIRSATGALWIRQVRCDTEICSRWVPAALLGVTGRGGGSRKQRFVETWASGIFVGAGVGMVAMEMDEWNGVAACEGAEQNLPSPMGKTPASKLAQPRYFLGEAYRRRVFFNYERRLRMRSPPEKVFEYFSSVRGERGHTLMSAGDLMRAVVPVFPPTGSHLVREGYLGGERSPGELKCPPSKFFMLFDVNGDGFISFPEYIFFVTLLSISEKNVSATFRMFDLDGNGVVDKEEFKKVMTWMRTQSRHGSLHTHGLRTGLKVSGDIENAGLVELFFGKDGQRELPVAEFETFLRELHAEIIHLEFLHYDFENRGTISATDFGLSMAASANLSKLNHYLDRVQDIATDPHFAGMRITLEEFIQFAELRKQLPVMALAISSFGKIQGELTKKDVQRAAAKICHAPISDSVVDIIFHIFDTDGDGTLSMDEFLGVLQRRERDIADPTQPGIVQFWTCLWKCAGYCQKPWFI